MTIRLADLDWPRRTARLELRPARPEDAAEVWGWCRRPEVVEYMTGSPADAEEHRRDWEDRLERTVVGLREGRIIATGKVERQDAWSQQEMREQAKGTQAELGWMLDPDVHGRGYGTEFAAALLDIAFDGLGVRRVEAACFAPNRASARIMEKIGMRREGYYREESLHRSGRWVDAISCAMLASEHAEARSRGNVLPVQ